MTQAQDLIHSPIGTILMWVLSLAVLLLLSKTILGWVFISTSKSGLVSKKWSTKGDLPMGKIIATKGEAGIQADLLPPGLHWFKWWWMYDIEMIDPIIIKSGHIGVVRAENGLPIESGFILAKTATDSDDYQDAKKFLDNGGIMGVQRQFIRNGVYRINPALFKITEHPAIQIPSGAIGIVTVNDGQPINQGEIAARTLVKHKSFQDADMFLNAGGQRGLQEEVLLPGEYYINPEFASVEIYEQVKVPIGHVAVITSFIGDEPEDTSGEDFKHGIIVNNGQKGVQKNPLNPGMYPLNPKICAVEIVPTTNIVLNWASAKTESHALDSHLSTITARTKDGFPINLDVSQIINIAHDDAPKVIARFGTLRNLISQVLEPTIGNHFRNSVQESEALEFITKRKEMQQNAKTYIANLLSGYNVVGVDTLIGDVIPPEQLMAPIREKHIAQQNLEKFEVQKKAEIGRKELEKATADANMQGLVIQAQQEVIISERHAESVVKTQEGNSKALLIQTEAEARSIKMKAEAQGYQIQNIGSSEANVILEKGKATAESYKLQIDSMGADNFTRMQVMESLSESGISIVPTIVGGGGDSNISSLVGLQLLEKLGALPENIPNAKAPVEHKK